jgi:ABC-type phosphate transport system auxiliary subunit
MNVLVNGNIHDESELVDGVYYSKPLRTIRRLLVQVKIKNREIEIKDGEIERLRLTKASLDLQICEISELRRSVNKLTAEKSKWARNHKKMISI